MKKLVVLLLVSLMASSAFAVLDEDPNGIGVYFDAEAMDNCAMIGPGQSFIAYVILTNTTAPSVSAYEVGYTNVVPAGMEGLLIRTGSSIANGVVDGLDLGSNNDALVGDHIVGLAAPLVAGPATVLHSWTFIYFPPTEGTFTMNMSISSSNPSSIPGTLPVILNADDSSLFQAYHSTGVDEETGEQLPVATVNVDDCVVGVEEVSFGSVKSLFR